MTTVDTPMKPAEAQTSEEPDTGCAVCAHAWSEHDTIAARYCKATVAGQFKRGCVCTTVKS